MISYDEYIENQFLLKLQRGRRRSERRLHHLIRFFEAAEDELRDETRESDNDPIRSLAMDCEQYEKLNARLAKANEILNRARYTVENAGLGHLARLIHEEWLPGNILPAFRNALFKLLRESDVPHFEMMPFEFELARSTPDNHEFVSDLRKQILMELRHFLEREATAKGQMTAEALAGVIAGIAGLSLSPSLWHSPFGREISGLFAGVLTIELRHWSQRTEEQSGRCSVQRFLAQETVKQNAIEKEMDMAMHQRFFRHAMMKESGGGFADFYKACTSAQARLIDATADSRFLLQLLRFVVKGEMEEGALFPFVRGLAEDVIINKSVNHEEAPAKMAKALQTAEYFRDFDGVLTKVLADWGVGV